jgi:hypothetical protein
MAGDTRPCTALLACFLMPAWGLGKSPPRPPVVPLEDCRFTPPPVLRRRLADQGFGGFTGCAPLLAGPSALGGIPRVIHQVWTSTRRGGRFRDVRLEDLPLKNRAPSASWRRLMPGFVHKLWGNEEVRELIRNSYPDLLPTYDAYPLDVMRSDAARYVVMGAVGGLYVDSDVELLNPLPDSWFEQSGSSLLLFAHGGGCGISQFIFGSAAGHELWSFVADSLVHAGHLADVLYATGPPFLGRVFKVAHAIGMDYTMINGKSVFYDTTSAACGYMKHNFGSTWGHSMGAWVRAKCAAAPACHAVNLASAAASMQARSPSACIRECFSLHNLTSVHELHNSRAPLQSAAWSVRIEACTNASTWRAPDVWDHRADWEACQPRPGAPQKAYKSARHEPRSGHGGPVVPFVAAGEPSAALPAGTGDSDGSGGAGAHGVGSVRARPPFKQWHGWHVRDSPGGGGAVGDGRTQ